MRVNSVKLGVIFVHRCVMGRDLIEAHAAFPVVDDGVHLLHQASCFPAAPTRRPRVSIMTALISTTPTTNCCQ